MKIIVKIINILSFCLLVFGLHSCALADSVLVNPKETLKKNTFPKTLVHKIRFTTLEVAEKPQELARGLMERKSLCSECAMLFVFSEPGIFPFWMKNTHLPLDIIFIAENGRIVDVFQNVEPMNENIQYWPRDKAKYVLETNAGFSEQHKLSAGDKIDLNYLLKKGITAYQFQ